MFCSHTVDIFSTHSIAYLTHAPQQPLYAKMAGQVLGQKAYSVLLVICNACACPKGGILTIAIMVPNTQDLIMEVIRSQPETALCADSKMTLAGTSYTRSASIMLHASPGNHMLHSVRAVSFWHLKNIDIANKQSPCTKRASRGASPTSFPLPTYSQATTQNCAMTEEGISAAKMMAEIQRKT